MATNMIKLIKRKEQKSKVPLVIRKLLFTLFLSNLKITIIFVLAYVGFFVKKFVNKCNVSFGYCRA